MSVTYLWVLCPQILQNLGSIPTNLNHDELCPSHLLGSDKNHLYFGSHFLPLITQKSIHYLHRYLLTQLACLKQALNYYHLSQYSQRYLTFTCQASYLTPSSQQETKHYRWHLGMVSYLHPFSLFSSHLVLRYSLSFYLPSSLASLVYSVFLPRSILICFKSFLLLLSQNLGCLSQNFAISTVFSFSLLNLTYHQTSHHFIKLDQDVDLMRIVSY